MTRFLAAACLALAGLAAWGPAMARAQYYVSPYCPPAPAVSYYAAPVTSYYAPPAYSYSFYPQTYTAPSYTAYAAPVYAYRAPVYSYYGAPAAVSTSYYERPGLLRPRVYSSSSYYYPASSYYNPAPYYSPLYFRY